MDFPITSFLDAATSYRWLLRHFHPDGLKCVHCGASIEQARHFRTTKRSQVPVYHYEPCKGVYTLYSGTMFERPHFRLAKVVLLLRGTFKGESSQQLARELQIARQSAHHYRHAM